MSVKRNIKEKKSKNKYTNYLLFVTGLVAFLVLGNIVLEESNNTLPSELDKRKFTIISENESIGKLFPNASVEASVYTANVMLIQKTTQQELEKISINLRSENKTKAKGIRYYFYLPGMDLNGNAWATTVFNPNMHVSIIGRTVNEDDAIEKYLKEPETGLIGEWKDSEDQPYDILKRIRMDENGGYILELYSPSEDKIIPIAKLIKKASTKGMLFVESEDDFPEQHYLINNSGDLECYDSQGLIVVMKKLK